MERMLNRSFMVDPEDRLYKDGILAWPEGGKLNPKAMLRAPAAFLDLPYTEDMEVCSEGGDAGALSGRRRVCPRVRSGYGLPNV